MWILVVAVGLYVALAAATDLRMRRIPNYLTVPAALAGLAYHTLAPTGWGLGTSAGGLAVGFALLLLPWLAGGGGMGDVKLLAALGAWLGTRWLLITFAVSACCAAAIALGVLVFAATQQGVADTSRRYLRARRPSGVPTGRGRGKSGGKRPARVLPFAVPVALSTYAVLAWLVVRGGL
ncbi:MAG: prepilin peptidase [Pirellulales bacterium]|nr:prepilin peptidase [Pirellulales bacterium]